MIGISTLFLCGDVMLCRGIDQILPYPGEAAL
jgi:poly-gamma-glutamate synthesis protein (capsule biosynthesis protein)